MKKTLFLLELIDYDHYDEIDEEDVEERYIIGYFFNSEKNECCFITSDMVFSVGGRVLSASLPYASEAIVVSGS